MARRRRRRSSAPPLPTAIILLIALMLVGWWLWQNYQPPATPPPVIQGPNRPIRIATWNLRKFSERARPDLVTIAKLIKDSEFDLIAIQEVQEQGQAVQRLRRQLGEPWRHLISDRTGNNERFAFLYRADLIEPLGEPRFILSPNASVFNRVPFEADFRAGNFDFKLITVHLWYGDSGPNDRRQREAVALANYAGSTLASSREKDLIVLGDFNEFRSARYLDAFQDHAFRRLITEPTNLSSTEIYDNLLICSQYTPEYANRAGVVRFDETLFQDDKTASDDISDHRPAWADFRTDLPDDD